jgi:hypothetical protein
MDLILYATAQNGGHAELVARLQGIMPMVSIILCDSTATLSQSLLRPLTEVLAVVLYVGQRKELSDLLSLGDLLHDTRVILILPDSASDLLLAGHALRPRFLTTAGEGFDGVVAVVEKIARRAKEEGKSLVEA